jgi:hypothetical protein
VLDHFTSAAPDYDYAAALASLGARALLQVAGAALLALAVLALASRVGPLVFASTALAATLYALTPVHYYFSVLVLLLLPDAGTAHRPGYAVTWTALFAWSAAGYATLLATDSRAFVNSAILSTGLFAVLLAHWAAWRAAPPRPAGARPSQTPPGSRS